MLDGPLIIITYRISAFPQNLHIDFYLMRLLMAHVGGHKIRLSGGLLSFNLCMINT